MGWFQFQWFAQLSLNLNGSCGCLPRYSSQIDVPAGDVDGHLDECCDTQGFNPTARIVGINLGAFGDFPLVILGVYP